MEEKRRRKRKIDISGSSEKKRRGDSEISNRKRPTGSSGRVKRLGDSEALERSRRLETSNRKKKTMKKTTGRKSSGVKAKRHHQRNIIGRVIQVLLAVALVCVLFYVVRNFGEGNKLNNKGLEAYAQADYETAHDYFTKAIEYDGGNGEYYMNQGMARSELKLYDDAMVSFNKALELMKRDRDIQLVYRAMGISQLYQGNYEEALNCFNQALDGKESRFSATEIDILYYKAETQDKAGKYVEAVMTYTQLVDAEKSADAYMLRGMEYVKVGDGTSAEADLRIAIKKDKKNYEIYLALYEALVSQNKTEDAKAVLNEALGLGGNKAKDLVNQGNIYLKLGDLTMAEEKLQKALDKGEISANLGLAELSTQKSPADYTLACQYYETYVAEIRDNAEAYNDYGLCLMEMGDPAKAETIFTQGVALNNRLLDRMISKNQIFAAEQAGHWEKALEYINVYLDKYSDDSAAAREKTFIQTRIR
ncbi:tetratricopeptide repeat protein [Frisingicoccus caecimuris]|uniref:Tetratricopeptide repeat protein n=2 Tax=Frisingicoccus caecimuris TaxID=1796636 RepID=A0A4R2LDZ3_9FIRM|nr:tetratricopeptide repeat protein [Frisingicoccus caecimuris]